MALVDDLLARTRARPGIPCALGQHLTQLSEAERVELIAAINDRRVPLVVLGDYLNEHGLTVKALTVGKHRRRVCTSCSDAGYFA